MANKFDKQLERMEYLMGYRMPTNESKHSNVAYSAEAADGKRYGIIKEGAKYYIKVCNDKTKANLAESYDYIHGITSKKEHEYKNYNEATKHFELKFMSLNESHGAAVKSSTIDFKKSEKTLTYLTEEARKELDRMHSILENSMTIGMKNTGNPEAPKTATFDPSIGTPFEEKAEAKLDKDLKATASDPKKVGEPFEKEEKVTDSDMESDKAPKGCESCDDYEDAKYVPEDAVAAKKPSGGKVVRVNEGVDDILGIDKEATMVGDSVIDDETVDTLTRTEDEEPISEILPNEDNMTDFEVSDALVNGETEDVVEPQEDAEPFKSDDEFMTDREFDEKRMSMESKSSLKTIVEGVCKELFKEHITVTKKSKEEKLMESFQRKVDEIVSEEVHNLNVFGKHPGYRKKPMTTPSNKEVIVTSGDKDWNDDSVKGEQPFGQKIGSSAPFDEKVINMLTDAVMNTIKESLKKK